MVAAVIGMIPEGLYLLVSIALAMSAAHLASMKVMLHNMKSIETLARVDTLCVDKTGTITDNSMLVAKVIPVKGRTPEQETADRIHITDYITTLSDDNQTMQALRNYFLEMGRPSARRAAASSGSGWSGRQASPPASACRPAGRAPCRGC